MQGVIPRHREGYVNCCINFKAAFDWSSRVGVRPSSVGGAVWQS